MAAHFFGLHVTQLLSEGFLGDLRSLIAQAGRKNEVALLTHAWTCHKQLWITPTSLSLGIFVCGNNRSNVLLARLLGGLNMALYLKAFGTLPAASNGINTF